MTTHSQMKKENVLKMFSDLNISSIFSNEDDESLNIVEDFNDNSEDFLDNDSYRLYFKYDNDKQENNINKKEKKTNSKKNPSFIITKQIPDCIFEKEIFHILETKNINKEIINMNKANINIHNNIVESIKNDLSSEIITRKRPGKKEETHQKENILLGRKRKNDESIRYHNKYSIDNIMNKIRNVLKKYLIIFVNNILNNLYNCNQKKLILNKLKFPDKTFSLIMNLDYKFIANIIRKNKNLKFLKYSIKELLSNDISSKYKNIIIESLQPNKIIIDYLLTDTKNKDIFDCIFNKLTVGNFLDIFLYIKDLTDFFFIKTLDTDKVILLEKSLLRIDHYLPKLNNEGNIYFSCFLMLIYNYERYYSCLQGRKEKKTKKKSNK